MEDIWGECPYDKRGRRMKLRNKTTGEVGKARLGNREIYVDTDDKTYCYVKDVDKFCKEWECVKPVEPLIKDEKIRKAVRAWAEGNMVTRVQYDAFWRGFRNRDSTITVWEELPLEDNKTYTIAELCGEEE